MTPFLKNHFLSITISAVAAIASVSLLLSHSPAIAMSNHDETCLPIKMPSQDIILNSDKKIFAHYFNRFPLSIDNKRYNDDYYVNNYLNPLGEKGKWQSNGGFLRSRPFPVDPKFTSQYKIENLKTEIRMAIARGVNGFTFNILSLKDIEPDMALDNMLKAAKEVDPRFTIVVMPDMYTLKQGISEVETIVNTLYNREGLYRSNDGRLVVAPFMSEAVPPQDWQKLTEKLEAAGKPITLISTFLSTKGEYVEKYLPVSDGIGIFGTPLIGQGSAQHNPKNAAKAQQKTYMAGISPQGSRTKAYIYWESHGSAAYRDIWENIISADVDSIQLTTWNDFAESTQVSPYTDTEGTSGTGYYNLTGYYAAWYLTGKKPEIVRDALYYFHRKHSITAATPKLGQAMKASPWHVKGVDIIDVVAFLTAPGTVEVTVNGVTHSRALEGGLQSFTVPLEQGTPRFTLIRDGKTLINFSSDAKIYGAEGIPSGYGDLTYWSGGATTNGQCSAKTLNLVE